MIQINLVPDIKQEYLKAQRTRNMAISISILAGLAAVAVVVILGLILGGQYVLDAQAKGRIESEYKKLSSVEDLSEILTIQNQLTVLPEQHLMSTRDSRLFVVINAINPAEPDSVTFSSVKLDPASKIVTLEGSAAGGYPAVEALKKTIESTKFEYTAKGSDQNTSEPLASSVGIENTSLGEDNSGAKVIRFTINFEYAEDLFVNTVSNAKIVSPTAKIDVTDSKIRVPESLFQAANDDQEQQ